MAIYRVEQWDEIGLYGKAITVPTLADAIKHLRAAGDSIVAIENGVERPCHSLDKFCRQRIVVNAQPNLHFRPA